MNIVKVDYREFGIAEKKANELTVGLSVTIAERELLILEFNSLSKLELTLETVKKFRVLRLKVVKNRTKGINAWHKTNKEYFYTGGKFIDAIKNKEIHINEQMEEKLLAGEKHFENIEKEALEKLTSERTNEALKFGQDATLIPLGAMDEETWHNYITTIEAGFKAKVKAEKEKAEAEKLKLIEDEKKAKEKRIADAKLESERQAKEKAEKEKLKAENELLRIENEKRLKLIAEAEERSEKIRLENQKKIAKIEAENLRLKKSETIKRIKEEKEAEAKLKADLEETRLKKELDLKPDKEQAEYFIRNYTNLIGIENTCINSPEVIKMLEGIEQSFQRFKKWAQTQIEEI